MSDRLRIVATNDLVATVSPLVTTYGWLPGFEGVRTAVAELALDGVPTLWLDAGDFAGWSPLSSLTAGRASFAAFAELPVAAACPGNHELDWGEERFRSAAQAMRTPVVCANLDLGIPATAVLGRVGVVGMTPPFTSASSDLVRSSITELRGQGCRFVVALVHDGLARRGPGVTARYFLERHGEWVDDVDLVVAGHTLVRWLGHVKRTAFVQPWAFTAEIAVAETDGDPGGWTMRAVSPRTGRNWRGAGAGQYDEAVRLVHGHIDHTLTNTFAGRHDLADLLAEAMRAAAGASAALFPSAYCATQPAIDGTYAALLAGPVTDIDIRRLAPMVDDSIVVGDIDQQEWEAIRSAMTPPGRGHWWTNYPLQPGRVDPPSRRGAVAFAMLGAFRGDIDHIVGRRVDWRSAGVGLRVALCELLRSAHVLGVRQR